MERLISRTTVSPAQPRIHLPGRSPFLPTRRAASASAGAGSAAPWARLCAQPPRLGAAVAAAVRRDGASAPAPIKEVAAAAAAAGPPWNLLGSLLPKASTAALVLLMTLTASALHSSIPHPAYASVQPVIKSGGLLSTELLSSGWAGFFAGCLHTLSGPDHLVALAPLSIGRSRLESGLVGALWGCGHDAGQIIFGLLFLLLKDRLHIEVLRIWGTRVVGLTLLMIGATGIREASEVQESGLILEGVDMSGGEPLQQAPAVAPRKKKVGFTTFATGVVHGLQPDALLMVLPALALPSRFAGAAYLAEICIQAMSPAARRTARPNPAFAWTEVAVEEGGGVLLAPGPAAGMGDDGEEEPGTTSITTFMLAASVGLQWPVMPQMK